MYDKEEAKKANEAPARDYGLQGDILIAVKQMIEEAQANTFAKVHAAIRAQAEREHRPILDRLPHYLSLLYEAQKVGHDVHKEIDEALKRFKQEIGM